MEKRISATKQYERKRHLADKLYAKMMSYTTPASFEKASNLIVLDNHKILFRKKSGDRYILKSLFKYALDSHGNAIFDLNLGYCNQVQNFYSFLIKDEYLKFKNEKFIFLSHDWFRYGAQKFKNIIDSKLSKILFNSHLLRMSVIMSETESYILMPFFTYSPIIRRQFSYDLKFDLDFNLKSITFDLYDINLHEYIVFDLDKFSEHNMIKAFEVIFSYYMDDTVCHSIDNSGVDYLTLPATFFNDDNISTYHDLVCMINV